MNCDDAKMRLASSPEISEKMAAESHVCSGLAGEEGALRCRLQAKLNRDLVAEAPATRELPRQDGVNCSRPVATHLCPFIDGKMHEWELHCRGAITNGVTREEIRAILHVIGIYCGVPQALECFRAARKVLEEQPAP